jgi:hypothetical protein
VPSLTPEPAPAPELPAAPPPPPSRPKTWSLPSVRVAKPVRTIATIVKEIRDVSGDVREARILGLRDEALKLRASAKSSEADSKNALIAAGAAGGFLVLQNVPIWATSLATGLFAWLAIPAVIVAIGALLLSIGRARSARDMELRAGRIEAAIDFVGVRSYES